MFIAELSPHRQQSFVKKVVSQALVVFFVTSLIIPPNLHAQPLDLSLPVPGKMLELTKPYMPVTVKGLMVHPENPFRFDFLVDSGDTGVKGEALKSESMKLIKYFLAALTVPEEEMWVNLSPFEKERIIPQSFGDTQMGRDLLAQDYILKQLAASLTYPEQQMGKKFWDKVFAQAQAKFGTTQIPVNTFNKVWILPSKAKVYEHNNGAFVVDSRLKVMLEQDYLAMEKTKDHRPETKDLKEISKIVREIVVPAIEKEVNEGAHFANLRQIYQAMILATWYKIRLKDSILGKQYVNQHKTKGVAIDDKQATEKIYQQYLKAFKKGVYNYIKEDHDSATQQIVPRKYVSGGYDNAQLPHIEEIIHSPNPAAVATAMQIHGDPAMVAWLGKTDAAMAATDQITIQSGLFRGLSDAMEALANRDLTNVRVLFRSNQNVPINGRGEIEDTERLKEALPMLDFLLGKGAEVILIGHHGRLEGKNDTRKSLAPTERFFQQQFPDVSVKFYPGSINENGLNITANDLVRDPMKHGKGSLHILENLRAAIDYEQGEKGSERREKFGRQLAALGNIAVVDAYADIGSEGASIEDLPGYFVDEDKEIFVGPSMVQESGKLGSAAERGVDAVIMGGVKPDKLKLVKGVVRALSENGFALLASAPSSQLASNPLIQDIVTENGERVLIARDYNPPGETFDIGDETTRVFKEKLDTLQAGQSILINGTMGWVEEGHTKGTEEIFKKLGELARRGVNVIFVGGDSSLNARKYHLDQLENVIFITGGGVTFRIIAREELVGVKAMKEAMLRRTIQSLSRHQTLSDQEFENLKQLTLSNKIQREVFGITEANVDSELHERIRIFNKTVGGFRALMQELKINDMGEDMFWSIYVPLSLWLFRQKMAKRPNESYNVGFYGTLGVGKTTRTKILAGVLGEMLKERGEIVVVWSIDDLYKTKAERELLKPAGFRFNVFRGPPGTHDVGLGVEVFNNLRHTTPNSRVAIPVFDKAVDDRVAPRWVEGKVGMVIFEGWMVGTNTDVNPALIEAPYKRHIAEELIKYGPLNAALDDLIVRQTHDLDIVKRMYRNQVERQRAAVEAAGGVWRGLQDEEIDPFVDSFYEDIWEPGVTSVEPRLQDTSIQVITDDKRRIIDMRLGGRNKAASQDAAMAGAVETKAPRRVLVVGHSRGSLYVALALKNFGYSVVVVEDGISALHKLGSKREQEEGKFAVVVGPSHMPLGYETHQELQAVMQISPILRQVPVFSLEDGLEDIPERVSNILGKPDAAMAGHVDQTAVDGGIDLNRKGLDLQIRQEDKAMAVRFKNLDNIKIDALYPVILDVVSPVPNLPMILGFDQKTLPGNSQTPGKLSKINDPYLRRELLDCDFV